MADVKFPNIAQSNNNSFVDTRANRMGNLSEYNDQNNIRNGADARSQSFNSGRLGSGNGNGTSIMNAKKQRKE